METENKKGRPAGQPKTGGRAKGSKNTKNVAMETNIRLFVNQNFEKMTLAWERIEDNYQKVKAFTDIMNYVYPKMRSIEFKGEVQSKGLEERLIEMMNEGK